MVLWAEREINIDKKGQNVSKLGMGVGKWMETKRRRGEETSTTRLPTKGKLKNGIEKRKKTVEWNESKCG